MAKKQTARSEPARAAATPTKSTLAIDITPAPEAQQGLSLVSQARAIRVVDKATHTEALEFIRGAKQLKRTIEDHWSRITRSVDDMKKNLLTFKRQDVAPVDQAISIVEGPVLEYQQAEERRVQLEQQRQREENERQAREERARQLREAEEQALQLEALSEDLSAREIEFVTAILNDVSPIDAARAAGYKDATAQAGRLMVSQKILKAIRAQREALAIRQQAKAREAEPLDVAPVRKVQAETAKVAGIRTTETWTLDEEAADPEVRAANLKALVLAMVERGEFEALEPNRPYLNRKAKDLKDKFSQAYPGCTATRRAGIAG